MSWYFFQFLEQQEAVTWAQRVLTRPDLWTKRNEHLPFYTIGLSSYLDKYSKNDSRIIENNAKIRQNFSLLYKKIFDNLGLCFGVDVDIMDGAACPGFQIYLEHPLLETAEIIHGKNPHVDVQFRNVVTEKGIKTSDFISFTLTLFASPGAGLKIWKPPVDLPEDTFDSLMASSVISVLGSSHPLNISAAAAMLNKETALIEYRPGCMFIHNGLFWHYPVLKASKQPRITLQGHGIIKDNKLQTFF
jgi:hypothetical protein